MKIILACNINPKCEKEELIRYHAQRDSINLQKIKLYRPDDGLAYKLRNMFTHTEDMSLNANVLDYLIINQHLIPEDWKGKRIFFLGTMFSDKDGSFFKILEYSDYSKRWEEDKMHMDYLWTPESNSFAAILG